MDSGLGNQGSLDVTDESAVAVIEDTERDEGLSERSFTDTMSSTCGSSSQQQSNKPDNDTCTFHEDTSNNTFGRLTKGGKYKVYADFRFEFTAKVAGKGVSGYLLDVYPAKYEDQDSEGPVKCFFSCENAHQVKQDFMKSINHAVKGGGFLTCSLRDNEFGDFLLFKKRSITSQLPTKRAVSYCGLQLGIEREILPTSVWVLGPDLFIGKNGQQINLNDSNFVWLSHLDCRAAAGVSLPSVAVPVHLPLGTAGLLQVVDAMKSIMRHNFFPALLALGAGVMALHYSKIVRKRGHCHVPVLYGYSQTGKTTALQLALALFGCHRLTFYSRGSKEAYLKKCCNSTLPVGCDDPQSEVCTGQLIIQLFNGAMSTVIKHGDQLPLTCCLISANFNLSETAKHVSRTTLIEFSLPEIGGDQTADEREMWDNLEDIKDRASSCVGLCIGLGDQLEQVGYKDIREHFSPLVEGVLPGVQPRVITGYATLLWFTSQLLQSISLSDLAGDVVNHFKMKQAPRICSFQQAQSVKPRSALVSRASHLDIVMSCISKVITLAKEMQNQEEVSAYAKIDTHLPANKIKHNVLAFRYERMPVEVFTKSELTTALTLGNMGLTNQAKTFRGKREKATIIYLDKLPHDFVMEITQAFPDERRGNKGPIKGLDTSTSSATITRAPPDDDPPLSDLFSPDDDPFPAPGTIDHSNVPSSDDCTPNTDNQPHVVIPDDHPPLLDMPSSEYGSSPLPDTENQTTNDNPLLSNAEFPSQDDGPPLSSLSSPGNMCGNGVTLTPGTINHSQMSFPDDGPSPSPNKSKHGGRRKRKNDLRDDLSSYYMPKRSLRVRKPPKKL